MTAIHCALWLIDRGGQGVRAPNLRAAAALRMFRATPRSCGPVVRNHPGCLCFRRPPALFRFRPWRPPFRPQTPRRAGRDPIRPDRVQDFPPFPARSAPGARESATGGSPSIEPKFPCPSIKGKLIEKS